MASFVYSSTDALVRFARWAKASRQGLVVAKHCDLTILEWPISGIWLLYYYNYSPNRLTTTVPAFVTRDKPKLRIMYILKPQNITLVQGSDGGPSIQDPRHSKPSQESDGTWLKSGVFLRWRQPAVGDDDSGEVDMIIFRPTIPLQKNFECLIHRPEWRQALEDPFSLLVVVLDDLHRQVDEARAKLHEALRSAENRVLSNAGPGATGASFNFVAMYNIAKHVIHVKESSNAAFLAASKIAEAHRTLMFESKHRSGEKTTEGVQALIQHKLTLLESCKLQAQSLDSRAQNMTNLAFNTVNQHDSRTMKADSQSMKVIATVTMFFLPAATIG
ncbi:MAG: hypothetical protein Q9204_006184, partial [Flavoplaca sp. TL-2023a]